MILESKWIPLIAAAVVGALVISGPVALVSYRSGGSNKEIEIKAKSLQEAFNRIKERELADEAFRRLSTRDKCIALAPNSGMQLSDCD